MEREKREGEINNEQLRNKNIIRMAGRCITQD